MFRAASSVWSAIATIHEYEGKNCRLEVKKASQFLTALSSNSRDLIQ
jgi:hypothetical protein